MDWPQLVATLAAPVVAVLALLLANRREAQRQEHERQMQRLEIEERRWSTLRDERIRAYATLARLTKRVDVSVGNPQLPAVVEAHSEVELLAENPELRKVADDLFDMWEAAWRSVRNAIDAGKPDPYDAPGYKNVRGLLEALRAAFIELAREEIEASAQSREEPPEGATAAGLPGDAQASAQHP